MKAFCWSKMKKLYGPPSVTVCAAKDTWWKPRQMGVKASTRPPIILLISSFWMSCFPAVMVLMFAVISAQRGWPLRFCSSRSEMRRSIRWWALNLAPMIM